MAHIVAYHPEFFVRRGAELLSLKLCLDDWAPDEEVLDMLVSETGGRTMGQVVERIEKDGNIHIRIEKVEKVREGRLVGEGRKIYDWADAI